ncbi:MAG: type II toxin-antitoxin system PemK/MazF family toxin [Candidatus Anammoxibacter sp.]
MYNSGDIVLVNFPFTNLAGSKVRPALIISKKKEDIIVVGIFSKLPNVFEDSWFMISEKESWFKQAGLKKSSLVKTEKIAVIHMSIIRKTLGLLPDNIYSLIKKKLKETLSI